MALATQSSPLGPWIRNDSRKLRFICS